MLPSMNRPEEPIGRPPDPWHYDSVRLLQDLDRVRQLILGIPVTAQSHGPAQTAVDAMWRLQEDLRYMLRLHSDGLASFRRQAETLSAPHPRDDKRGRPRLVAGGKS